MKNFFSEISILLKMDSWLWKKISFKKGKRERPESYKANKICDLLDAPWLWFFSIFISYNLFKVVTTNPDVVPWHCTISFRRGTLHYKNEDLFYLKKCFCECATVARWDLIIWRQDFPLFEITEKLRSVQNLRNDDIVLGRPRLIKY